MQRTRRLLTAATAAALMIGLVAATMIGAQETEEPRDDGFIFWTADEIDSESSLGCGSMPVYAMSDAVVAENGSTTADASRSLGATSCPTFFSFEVDENFTFDGRDNFTINGTGTADFWVQCDPAAVDGGVVGDGTFAYLVTKNGTAVDEEEDDPQEGEAQQGLCTGGDPEHIVDDGIPVGDNVTFGPGDTLTLEVYWLAGPSDPGQAPHLQFLVASTETPSGFGAPGLPVGILAEEGAHGGNATGNFTGDAAQLNVTAEDQRSGAKAGGQAHFQIRVNNTNESDAVAYALRTLEAPEGWQTEYEPDGGVVPANETRQNLLRVMVPNGTEDGDYVVVVEANGTESSSEPVSLTVGVGDPGNRPGNATGNQTGPMPRPSSPTGNDSAPAGNQSSLDEGGDASAASVLVAAMAVAVGAVAARRGRGGA